MAGRGRTYDVLGILMQFHAFPDDVQGKYCLVEAVVPSGCGAPPNHHAGETECFYVLDGRVAFEIDGAQRDAGPGEYVAVPDGALHAFRATGDAPARMLILNAPGRMHEAFFTGVGQPLPEGQKALPEPREPDFAHVMETAAAVGMTIVPPQHAA